MRTELPVCKRCCFCLPLRYGLIVWGYFKLIVACLFTLMLSISLYQLVYLYVKYNVNLSQIIVMSVLLAVLIVDIVLHAIFVTGAHKKNLKLLKVFYIYSIITFVLTVLLGIACVGILICHFHLLIHSFYYMIMVMVTNLASLFLNLLIQVYVLLLVRSEIIKLRNVGQFTFVNNAAEAECTLNFQNSDDMKGINHDLGSEEKKEHPPSIKDVIYVCPGSLDTNVCCKEVVNNDTDIKPNKE